MAVWRELRKLGAVPLQQGTWVLPEGEGFDAGLTQVIATISEAGGQPVVLRVDDDDVGTVSLQDLFTAQREAEWGEFLSDCGKYEAELAGEIAKEQADSGRTRRGRGKPGTPSPVVPGDPCQGCLRCAECG